MKYDNGMTNWAYRIAGNIISRIYLEFDCIAKLMSCEYFGIYSTHIYCLTTSHPPTTTFMYQPNFQCVLLQLLYFLSSYFVILFQKVNYGTYLSHRITIYKVKVPSFFLRETFNITEVCCHYIGTIYMYSQTCL